MARNDVNDRLVIGRLSARARDHLFCQSMETALPRARRRKDFAVVVWVKKTDAFEELKSELASIAGSGPEESTEYEGMIDFHWRFDSHGEAKRLANSLREIARKPETSSCGCRATTTPRRPLL
jgi:hypothetical protein